VSRIGGATIPVGIVVAWWAVSAAEIVSPRLLPSPQDVVAAGADLAARGILVDDVAVSVMRVLCGFTAGSTIGLLVAAAVGRSRATRILLTPVVAAVRAVPTVAWLPLLLLYAGLGEAPKIALIAIGAAFPVFAGVLAAVDRDDPAAPRLDVALITALRAALAQSWTFLVTAELLHATAGVGFLLVDASRDGRADRLIVVILLIVALSRLSDVAMARHEHGVRRDERDHSGALPCSPPSSNGDVTPS
jgi:sulfonate transport system permease protein